jgi:hypothetical protein
LVNRTIFRKAADIAFGVKKLNGTWSGLMGMVDKNEIDVISTDILMENKRLEIVNFMEPVFEVRCHSTK